MQVVHLLRYFHYQILAYMEKHKTVIQKQYIQINSSTMK